jgi:hypothetical protein
MKSVETESILLFALVVVISAAMGVALWHDYSRDMRCRELGGVSANGVCIEGRIIPLD